jgi:hypothetical protein
MSGLSEGIVPVGGGGEGSGSSEFVIWAEESAELEQNGEEWAFGNGGETYNGCGIVFPFDVEIYGIGFSTIRQQYASLGILPKIDGVAYESGRMTLVNDINKAIEFTPISVTAGQALNFVVKDIVLNPTSGAIAMMYLRRVSA